MSMYLEDEKETTILNYPRKTLLPVRQFKRLMSRAPLLCLAKRKVLNVDDLPWDKTNIPSSELGQNQHLESI
ncbi:hypothetical protein M0802_010389 [Mischocyttarus mexicanus]|nr:hypothetical protein M0802_010389 [Mischocyttarus mexicanus]